MNYKLAKQLKDAGFPGSETCEKDELYHPTLSELIEACGKDLMALIPIWKSKDWVAYGEDYAFSGKTHEEAVAKLWLKLNK